MLGRRLPELFRRAGLIKIGVEASANIYPVGHSRRTIRADLVRSMRSKLVARGVASEQELDEIDRAARQHLHDPHTLVMPHLLFLGVGAQAGVLLGRYRPDLMSATGFRATAPVSWSVGGLRRYGRRRWVPSAEAR